jgi:hypothetical protein
MWGTRYVGDPISGREDEEALLPIPQPEPPCPVVADVDSVRSNRRKQTAVVADRYDVGVIKPQALDGNDVVAQ